MKVKSTLRFITTLLLVAMCLILTTYTYAQVPSLPAGAQTQWVVDQPEEIVSWVLFDPATVEHRLPTDLRFITISELASRGIGWAVDHLSKNPSQKAWGISFLEIVRMQTFSIDGQAPTWPKHGAAGLWFARVAPIDPATDLGPGQPFLALEFWLPDRVYVEDIRKKGHYATYGKVELHQNDEGIWRGSIDVNGLKVVAECNPTGSVTGGAGSAGRQAIFPPQSAGITSVVRIAFAGHRIQQCGEGSSWSIQGNHPLVTSIVLTPSEFQFAYELQGGAFNKTPMN